jgi:hypothetical protein
MMAAATTHIEETTNAPHNALNDQESNTVPSNSQANQQVSSGRLINGDLWVLNQNIDPSNSQSASQQHLQPQLRKELSSSVDFAGNKALTMIKNIKVVHFNTKESYEAAAADQKLSNEFHKEECSTPSRKVKTR